MAILRNTTGQGVYVRAIDAAGDPVTTGVTCQISKDGASEAAAGTAAVHVAGGAWWQALSQAETDAGAVSVRPTGTGVLPDPVIIITYEAMRGTDDASTHSAADVWSVATRDVTNMRGTDGASTHSAADVWAVTTRTLSAAGVQAIWDAATSALTSVGSIGKLLVDMLNAAVGTRSSHADPTSGIITHGDSNWATATGFSTHDAVAVRDAILDRVLDTNHDITGTVGAVLQYLDALISSRSSHTAEEAKADVSGLASQASVDALNDFDPSIQEVTTDSASREASKADVSALKPVPTQGTAQGGTGMSIQLAADEAAQNNLYQFSTVTIHGGTGAGQSRLITAYQGNDKVAEVDRAWTVNPDATSQYVIDGGTSQLAAHEHSGATIPTVTDVANPVALTQAERTAIREELEATGAKLDTIWRGRRRIREANGDWFLDLIDGNGSVVQTLPLKQFVGDMPAFDRVGDAPS